MNYDYLIFDLDGTISDPKDGIVRSVNYALDSHHFAPCGEQEISRLIGPPIEKLFAALTGSNDQGLLNSLITHVTHPSSTEVLGTMMSALKDKASLATQSGSN